MIGLVAVAALVPQLAGGAGAFGAGAAGAAPAARPLSGSCSTAFPGPAIRVRHRPDFDGDGYADLPAMATIDTVLANVQAGSFWAVYGGAHGANTGNRNAEFDESKTGHGPDSIAGDDLGWSFAWGDFNHDGYDDLAVGAPGESPGGKAFAGEVVVVYGSRSGLTTRGDQVFTEATSGLASTPQANDSFGLGLAAGDFNRDGYTDLAVDAGGVSVHGVARSGRVTELFGTAHGLSHAATLAPRHFDESTPGIHGGLKPGDYWGRTLASGDFNGDGYADLVVGAPHKKVGSAAGAGVVDILYGSAGGLTATGSQTWTEDTTGVPDSSETSDEWGWAFAVGDFDGDGRSDLVVGAPGESQGATASVGAATLLHGSAHGVTAAGSEFYLLSNTTNGQSPAANNQLGASLAAFDFDGDGHPDLAIGVPGRTVGGHAYAGEIVVLHGVRNRLSRDGGFVIDRDTLGVTGPSATNEDFGLVLTPGDFSGNGADDLAVSLPGLTVGGHAYAGGVQVFYGRRGGFGANDQLFTEANPLCGTAATNVFFGGYNYPPGI